MKDGIIKGNGTSRFIKSVPNFLSLYPTYEDFVAALIAGTLPIDLNGLNPAGWTQQGTELNKGHLLSDAAVSALGLTGTDPTPDDAFKALPTDAMLRKIINKQSARSPASGDYLGGNNGKISISNLLSYVKGQSIATGSYIGTGTYGPSNPCSLTFNFAPKLVAIQGQYKNHDDISTSTWALWVYGIKNINNIGASSGMNCKPTWKTRGISWWADDDYRQQNSLELVYHYFAIG